MSYEAVSETAIDSWLGFLFVLIRDSQCYWEKLILTPPFHSFQFHSHQIFHVLVVAAAFIHFYGVSNLQEFRYGLEGGCTDDSLLWGAWLWLIIFFITTQTHLKSCWNSIYNHLTLLLCFWFVNILFGFWWTFCLALFCSYKVALNSLWTIEGTFNEHYVFCNYEAWSLHFQVRSKWNYQNRVYI